MKTIYFAASSPDGYIADQNHSLDWLFQFGEPTSDIKWSFLDLRPVSTELAIKIAKKAGLPEKLALQACLQDQVHKAGSEAKVAVS